MVIQRRAELSKTVGELRSGVLSRNRASKPLHVNRPQKLSRLGVVKRSVAQQTCATSSSSRGGSQPSSMQSPLVEIKKKPGRRSRTKTSATEKDSRFQKILASVRPERRLRVRKNSHLHSS